MIHLLKKYRAIWLAVACLTGSCQSRDQAPCNSSAPINLKAPPTEVTSLKQYIELNNLKATADPRGFYYTIQAAGSGSKPTVCSNVTVNYKGQLTNGTEFDKGNGVSFGLDQLIVGWQEGIPLIAPGGTVTLYLPPSLAYGAQEQSGIPANSILVFQIDLIRVN